MTSQIPCWIIWWYIYVCESEAPEFGIFHPVWACCSLEQKCTSLLTIFKLWSLLRGIKYDSVGWNEMPGAAAGTCLCVPGCVDYAWYACIYMHMHLFMVSLFVLLINYSVSVETGRQVTGLSSRGRWMPGNSWETSWKVVFRWWYCFQSVGNSAKSTCCTVYTHIYFIDPSWFSHTPASVCLHTV